MVNLGDKVKDPVTNLEGIVIGRTEFLYGCTRIGVQPKISKDGKMPDAHWFDEPQLKVVKKAEIKRQTEAQKKVGGPMVSIPTRNQGPR